MSVKSCYSDHIEGSKGPEIGEYLKDLMDNCTPETGYFYFLFLFFIYRYCVSNPVSFIHTNRIQDLTLIRRTRR